MKNDYLDNKKNSKGLIAFCIFLVLCVLGLGGYIGYDKYIKKEKPKPVKKVETVKTINNYYLIKNSDDDADFSYNLYADGSYVGIIGYKDEVYYVNGLSSGDFGFRMSYFLEDCLKEMKLENNVYKCDLYKISGSKKEKADDEDSYYIITKLNDINEKDIQSVNVSHASEFSDPTEHFYIVNKDGSVKMYTTNEGESKENDGTTVFKNYKVKFVNEYCYKQKDVGCDPGYKLILQDGTEKKVTITD